MNTMSPLLLLHVDVSVISGASPAAVTQIPPTELPSLLYPTFIYPFNFFCRSNLIFIIEIPFSLYFCFTLHPRATGWHRARCLPATPQSFHHNPRHHHPQTIITTLPAHQYLTTAPQAAAQARTSYGKIF